MIDYALCGEALMPQIFSFSVLPFTELSDHCCISTNIRINAPQLNSDACDDAEITINPQKAKQTYDRSKKHIFQANVLLSENLDPLITLLNKTEISKTDLNLSITRLNEVILDAAKKSFPNRKFFIKNKGEKKRKQHRKKIWYNKECAKLRKILRKHSRNLSLTQFDRHKLHLFTKARLQYKRACRKAEKQNRKDLTEKLMNIGTNDPNTFWTIINKMNNWGKDQKEDTEHIKPSTLTNYFNKLLNKNESGNPSDNTVKGYRAGVRNI